MEPTGAPFCLYKWQTRVIAYPVRDFKGGVEDFGWGMCKVYSIQVTTDPSNINPILYALNYLTKIIIKHFLPFCQAILLFDHLPHPFPSIRL